MNTTNLQATIDRARRRARRRQQSAFVVWAGGEEGEEYDIADEEDLDSFWLGATLIAELMPDGTYLPAE